jgi:hypothetical protein
MISRLTSRSTAPSNTKDAMNATCKPSRVIRVVTRSDELLIERSTRRGHFRIWDKLAAHPPGAIVAMGVPDEFAETDFLGRESMELFCIGKLPLAVKQERELFQDIE